MILLPQLPASPSTLRVMVWRRMRDAGALGLQNGVWVLPDKAENTQVIEELKNYLTEHEANAYAFRVKAMEAEIEDAILLRLRHERDEEYAEFIERCDVLLEDLAQENQRATFTYAELEEAEADLKKLESWWSKCSQRDHVGGDRRSAALKKLESCRRECQSFAQKVYARHGLAAEEQAINEQEDQ